LREVLQHFKQKHGLNEMQLKERLPSSPTPSVVSCDTLQDSADCQQGLFLRSGAHEHLRNSLADIDEEDDGLEHTQAITDVDLEPPQSQHSTHGVPSIKSVDALQHSRSLRGQLHLHPCPSTPQKFLQMQLVFSRTQDSCRSFMCRGTSGKGRSVRVSSTYRFPCLMYNAGAHSVAGRHDASLLYYNAAADLVNNLLTSQSPLCLVLVYQLTCSRQKLGKEPNTTAMLRFISELASIRSTELRPLVQLVQSIPENAQTRAKLSELSVHQALVAFENNFGFVHPYTQEIAYRLCQTLMNRGAYYEAALLLQRMVAAHEALSGKCSYDACWTLMALGDCQLAQGNLDQAAWAYDDAAERARSPQIDQRNHIRVRYYQCTAELWRVQGEFEKAEVMVKLGIDLASEAFGQDDYRVIGIQQISSKIEQQRRGSPVCF
jgi:tetratricopeptide (TPR) repeat protein